MGKKNCSDLGVYQLNLGTHDWNGARLRFNVLFSSVMRATHAASPPSQGKVTETNINSSL